MNGTAKAQSFSGKIPRPAPWTVLSPISYPHVRHNCEVLRSQKCSRRARKIPAMSVTSFAPGGFMEKKGWKSEGTVKVLLADSGQTESQLLAAALERCGFQILPCPSKPGAILQIAEHQEIDVAVVGPGLDLAAADAMASLRTLHLVHPEIPKIFLMDSEDRESAVQAFRCGASGLFCPRTSTFQSLCECIEKAHRGEICASPEQLSYLLDALRQTSPFHLVNRKGDNLLTCREGQVVALVSDGLTNRDVAAELGLSEHTVKKYLFRIFDKLGISSRVELVLYALHNGALGRVAWESAQRATSRSGAAPA